MAGLNKVMLIGRLGGDPEKRYTAGGKAVTTLRIATTEIFGGRDKREERTQWHRVVCWEKLAETVADSLKKGRQVYVEGRLQTRNWTDREGSQRTTTEVIANTVLFLDTREKPEEALPETAETAAEVPAGTIPDEDIPF